MKQLDSFDEVTYHFLEVAPRAFTRVCAAAAHASTPSTRVCLRLRLLLCGARVGATGTSQPVGGGAPSPVPTRCGWGPSAWSAAWPALNRLAPPSWRWGLGGRGVQCASRRSGYGPAPTEKAKEQRPTLCLSGKVVQAQRRLCKASDKAGAPTPIVCACPWTDRWFSQVIRVHLHHTKGPLPAGTAAAGTPIKVRRLWRVGHGGPVQGAGGGLDS